MTACGARSHIKMLFYQYPRTASERQTQRHLPNSRRGATESPGGRDLAESWSVNVGRVIGKRRLRELRMIQCIEEFGAKFQLVTLRDGSSFGKGDVEIGQGRPAQDIAG